MNHIIVCYEPFTLEQKIYVYQEGACIDQANVSIDRVNDTVSGFRKKYNISNIDLCGNASYLSKFKAEMNLKFSDSNCNISIIER